MKDIGKPIGATFASELMGYGLSGAPIAWSADGIITGDENLTADQNVRLDQCCVAHDASHTDYLNPNFDMGKSIFDVVTGPPT